MFEFLTLENMAKAVGMLTLSQRQAEICGIPVCPPPSLLCDFRCARKNIYTQQREILVSASRQTQEWLIVLLSYFLDEFKAQSNRSLIFEVNFILFTLSPYQSAADNHVIMFKYSFCRAFIYEQNHGKSGLYMM